MKAGLPQKEGEEGDLEELCASNAYIRKRDLLIQALLSFFRTLISGARHKARCKKRGKSSDTYRSVQGCDCFRSLWVGVEVWKTPKHIPGASQRLSVRIKHRKPVQILQRKRGERMKGRG